MNYTSQFIAAIHSAGLEPPDDVEADGLLHRFSSSGKRGDEAGWYVLHGDGIPAGGFGCWRAGVSQTWRADIGRTLTQAEDAAHRARVDAMRKQREAEEVKRHAGAATKAAVLWNEAQLVATDHPYLTRKCVQAHGAKLHKGALVVPVRDIDGKLHSLQFIDADGGKRFLSGGRVKGCYFSIGKPNGVLCICEGFATGATIREATGHAAAVAFNSGNLRPVAEALRTKYPDLTLIVCADDDHRTDGNPGLSKAKEAAQAVGARLVAPDFGDDRPDGATDFNDMAAHRGPEAVHACINEAKSAHKQRIDEAEKGADSLNAHIPPPPDDLQNPPLLAYKEPLRSARELRAREFTTAGRPTVHWWQGDFYQWSGASYFQFSTDDVRAVFYKFLDRAEIYVPAEKKTAPFRPTRNLVADAVDALKAEANLNSQKVAPFWLNNEATPAHEFIALQNGLLHLPTSVLRAPTPDFFGLNSLEFSYDPSAPAPAQWIEFLSQLWPDDPESIRALQEIFGYLLSADTSQQKIILLVGPKRSGKGTIARILMKLLGQSNVAGPTLASLGQNFGLASLIGKQAAIISDARLSGKADHAAITERLLAISGEDHLSIPRKFQSDYTAKLGVRFMVLTNELPKLTDASGALASRFIILNLTQSFYGREDTRLTERLCSELPSILSWSIEGWHRLHQRGHFVQPASALEAVRELEDLSSPVGAFLRDCCEVNPAASVDCNEMFATWRTWCEQQGRDHPGTIQSFGRDLRAAVSGLKVIRPRVDGERDRRYQGVKKRDWSAVVRVPPHCEPDIYAGRKDGSTHSHAYGARNAVGRGPTRTSDKVEVEL